MIKVVVKSLNWSKRRIFQEVEWRVLLQVNEPLKLPFENGILSRLKLKGFILYLRLLVNINIFLLYFVPAFIRIIFKIYFQLFIF